MESIVKLGRLSGVFNILKPPGMSSHDVVKFIRENLKDTKVGHGGTLDPGAAGVLPVLVGRATKLSAFLLDYDKLYRGEVFLGKTTTTDDSAGELLTELPVPAINEQSLKRILKGFVGKLEQIPPLFSALKYKGKKYLDYARKGENIAPKPRTVQIYKCELVKFTPPNRVMLDIHCSKGTYIRSLARDLGEKIGCGGHLSFLVRLSTGPFKIENSITLEEFMEAAEKGLLSTVINTPDSCLPHFKNITLGGRELQRFLNGVKYKLNPSFLETGFCSPGEYFKVYNKCGACVALGQLVQGTNALYLQPVIILSEKI